MLSLFEKYLQEIMSTMRSPGQSAMLIAMKLKDMHIAKSNMSTKEWTCFVNCLRNLDILNTEQPQAVLEVGDPEPPLRRSKRPRNESKHHMCHLDLCQEAK